MPIEDFPALDERPLGVRERGKRSYTPPDVPLAIEEPRAPRPEQEQLPEGPYKIPPELAGYVETDPEGQYHCRSCIAFGADRKCLALAKTVSGDEGTCSLWKYGPNTASASTPAQTPPTKSEAGYEEDPRPFSCSECARFTPPDECSYIASRVSPKGHCWFFKRAVTEKPTSKRPGLGTLILGGLTGQRYPTPQP